MANGLKLDLETKEHHNFLPVRRPTRQELNNSDLDLIMLTSPHGWDPYNVDSSHTVIDLNGCDPYHVNSLRTITDLRSCPISHYLVTTIFRSFNEVKFKRKEAITPEDLISRWGIGLETSRLTLRGTYQAYTRETTNLSRRFKKSRVHSRFKALCGPYSQFYTDTLFSKVTSLRGNTCGQRFYNEARFYKLYPLKRKQEAHTMLFPLFELAGILSGKHSDRTPELITGSFLSILQKYRIRRTTTEPNTSKKIERKGRVLNLSRN